MEKSAEDRLRNGILERVPFGNSVTVGSVDDRIELRVGERLFLKVTLFRGEWMVMAAEGHAHLSSFEAVIDLVVGFLRGEARFANEYRGGDVLAAAWIEIWDQDAFEVHHQALYLSPFERDEWVLLPGEQWKVVRKSFALTASGLEESSFDYASETPVAQSPLFDKLNVALGPPEEGMRWAMNGPRFVIQAPSGWRRRPWDKDLPPNQADFGSGNSGLVFRSHYYFRDAELPGPKILGPIKPLSVEYKYQNPSEADANWVAHSWALHFTNGVQEMMGVLDLFAPVVSPEEAETLRPLIERSVPWARFVPEGWAMEPDASKN